MIDVAGQRVSARDRLYLAQEVPTLIVWGDRDGVIPVEHATRPTSSCPAAASRSSKAQATSCPSSTPLLLAVLEDFLATTEPARCHTDAGTRCSSPTGDGYQAERDGTPRLRIDGFQRERCDNRAEPDGRHHRRPEPTTQPMPAWLPRAMFLFFVGVATLATAYWLVQRLRGFLLILLISLLLAFRSSPP